MSVKIKNGKYEEDGFVCYFKGGLLHREDGPAVESMSGEKLWYIDGNLHRVDGPAVEEKGFLEWYIDGKLHRVDGPASVGSNGDKCWCKDGKAHREDGPAYVGSDGDKCWYVEGVQFSEEEFNHWLEKKKLNEKLNTSLKSSPSIKRGKI